MTRQTTKPEHVGSGLHQPRHARRHERQHEIDPHMLAAAQQPRRGEERDDVERVFGDFVGPGKSGAREIAQQDVGGDHHDHGQQRQRRDDGERVEQAAEECGKTRHGSEARQAQRPPSPGGEGRRATKSRAGVG